MVLVTGPEQAPLGILGQQVDEFRPRQRIGRSRPGARHQPVAGHPDSPVRLDQRGGKARPVKHPPRLAGQRPGQIDQRIADHHRRQPPDQEILRTPGAGHFGAPAFGAVGAGALERFGPAPAIAPGSAHRIGQPLGPAGVERQARWHGGGQLVFIKAIGADQPPGAIGDRHRAIGPLDRRDRHRPVRQGIFHRHFGLPARQRGPGQHPQPRQPADKARDQRRLARHQRHQRHADSQPRANQPPIAGPAHGKAGEAAAHSAPASRARRRWAAPARSRRRLARIHRAQAKPATT